MPGGMAGGVIGGEVSLLIGIELVKGVPWCV